MKLLTNLQSVEQPLDTGALNTMEASKLTILSVLSVIAIITFGIILELKLMKNLILIMAVSALGVMIVCFMMSIISAVVVCVTNVVEWVSNNEEERISSDGGLDDEHFIEMTNINPNQICYVEGMYLLTVNRIV